MISEYRRTINDILSKRALLKDQLNDKQKQINDKILYTKNLTKARWILSEASRITQKKFSAYLESVVTKALTSVFDRPFKFIVDFQMKRNKSECYFYVQDGDQEPQVPKDEMGGSVVDIISTALRTVLWSLENPRTRNVLIFDEPMKFVGKKELVRVGEMLKEISHKLGFQMVIITHEPELCNIADRSWYVSHNGTHSEVRRIDDDKEKESIG